MQLASHPLGLAVGRAGGKVAITIVSGNNPVITFVLEDAEAEAHIKAVQAARVGLVPASILVKAAK